jgi:hypothetical protein
VSADVKNCSELGTDKNKKTTNKTGDVKAGYDGFYIFTY